MKMKETRVLTFERFFVVRAAKNTRTDIYTWNTPSNTWAQFRNGHHKSESMHLSARALLYSMLTLFSHTNPERSCTNCEKKMLFRCGHSKSLFTKVIHVQNICVFCWCISTQFHREFKGFSFHCRVKKEFYLKEERKKLHQKGIWNVCIFLSLIILSFFLSWKIDGFMHAIDCLCNIAGQISNTHTDSRSTQLTRSNQCLFTLMHYWACTGIILWPRCSPVLPVLIWLECNSRIYLVVPLKEAFSFWAVHVIAVAKTKHERTRGIRIWASCVYLQSAVCIYIIRFIVSVRVGCVLYALRS